MVLAEEREKRNLAADILNSHGAEFVGFYGKWAWQSMAADGALSSGAASPKTQLRPSLDAPISTTTKRPSLPSTI